MNTINKMLCITYNVYRIVTKLEIRINREIVREMETVRKVREFYKIFWKIKILDFKEVQLKFINKILST